MVIRIDALPKSEKKRGIYIISSSPPTEKKEKLIYKIGMSATNLYNRLNSYNICPDFHAGFYIYALIFMYPPEEKATQSEVFQETYKFEQVFFKQLERKFGRDVHVDSKQITGAKEIFQINFNALKQFLSKFVSEHPDEIKNHIIYNKGTKSSYTTKPIHKMVLRSTDLMDIKNVPLVYDGRKLKEEKEEEKIIKMVKKFEEKEEKISKKLGKEKPVRKSPRKEKILPPGTIYRELLSI